MGWDFRLALALTRKGRRIAARTIQVPARGVIQSMKVKRASTIPST